MKSVLLHALILAALLSTGCRSTSDLRVVSGFEIDQYLGTWYEAARLPHRFEKDLTAVTAQYSRNPDGTIKVVNRGYNPGTRQWKDIQGVARWKSEPTEGWLKVSFFKPFYASYKILYLDEGYTRAIVTGPNYNYLWILVRDPALPKPELEQLISKAGEFGFDTARLQIIEHSMNDNQ